MKQAKLNLQHLKISDLKFADYNPRIITEDEFSGLNQSISTFGLVENIVVNKDLTVVGGHQRIRALQKQGYESVDCNVVDLDKKAEKKLNVILNSHAISGKYDDLKLSEILEELKLDDDYAELRLDVLEPLNLNEEVPPEEGQDEVPELKEEPFVVKGDIFEITTQGCKYRIGCLDSLSIDDVLKLTNNDKIDIVHTDPPYGMNAVSKSGVLKEKYHVDIAGDDNTDAANEGFNLAQSLQIPKQIWWGANYYSSCLPDSECWIVWDKNNGGSDQTDCELAWTNFRSVVRQYTQASEKTNRIHPTQKPVELIEWVFNKFSLEGSVLDIFCGSGSTAIACIKTKRSCYTCDISEHYTQVATKRCIEFMNKNNIQFDITLNGEPFDITKLN